MDASCYAGPIGGCYSNQSGFSPSPWSNDYNGPADALIGVFTNGAAPTLQTVNSYTGPEFAAGPDYTNPANVGPGVYTSSLQQIFLIGDGSGETFNVPTGATDLFLATADSLGGSHGNLGSIIVTSPAVPEPATWALMLTGFAVVGTAMRERGIIAQAIV